jgi:23S rRNA pseudouridine2605 synthase
MTSSGDAPKGVRLQKYLADAGIASRRKAEDLMRAGRVRVDGKTVREMGVRVDPETQAVEVDGEPVRPQRSRWVMVCKPEGCITTRTDPQGRQTIYDLLPPDFRGLRYVGRLDMDTEGLLLLTTDGDAMNRLLHPRYEVEREYLAWVEEAPPGEVYGKLKEGVELEDGLARAKDVRLVRGRGGGAILALVMQEGRKREVRRLLEAVGVSLRRLKRIRFGPLELGHMKPGEWRDLTSAEVAALTRPAPSHGARGGKGEGKKPSRGGGVKGKARRRRTEGRKDGGSRD